MIGYARTSTLDQKASIDAQVRDLKAAGCETILREQVSSVDVAKRIRLAEALEHIRKGDTLVVTKLDRLARSVRICSRSPKPSPGREWGCGFSISA